jgi:hypothetical protein
VLIGNLVVKDRQCRGNREVVHFGSDGGRDRQGTLYLVHNTVVTPFAAPVVRLSAPGSRAILVGNVVSDGGSGPEEQLLAVGPGEGGNPVPVAGQWNWFGPGYRLPGGTRLAADANIAGREPDLDFAWDGYAHPREMPRSSASKNRIPVPAFPGAELEDDLLRWQYLHPAGGERRRDGDIPFLGAFARRD